MDQVRERFLTNLIHNESISAGTPDSGGEVDQVREPPPWRRLGGAAKAKAWLAAAGEAGG